MNKLLAIFLCAFFVFHVLGFAKSSPTYVHQYPNPLFPYTLNPVSDYEGEPTDDVSDVMVPIPMSDRIFNETGIQCVWASIETLGRFAREPKLYGLINLPDCKGASNPASAAQKLTDLHVKYEQTINKQDRSLIVKSVVKERRGCLFAVPGHVMTMVHYDEDKGIVKYINNSDSSLVIRTWTMDEFNKRWDGWVCIIYADKDIIPKKYMPPDSDLPIIDKNSNQNTYPAGYILKPEKKNDLSGENHAD